MTLNQTFITPLDPEDLHSLSSHLDDVLDGIEDSAHRLVAYRLPQIPPTVVELSRIVRSCGETLRQAFVALSKDQPLTEHCIEINRLEEVADQLVRSAVSDLFQNEKDPIQLMKLKEIYEFLETDHGRLRGCGGRAAERSREEQLIRWIRYCSSVIIILVALVFDFINGFHDAANSIATIVSTRVLTPFQAVIWAAFFNFVAAFTRRDRRRENRRQRAWWICTMSRPT